MAIVDINGQNYKEEVKEGTVILYFTASWCGPCKMLKPVIEEISNELTDVKIKRVDVDENTEITNSLQIMSVPTLQLYKNGNLVDQRSGFAPKELLLDWINQYK